MGRSVSTKTGILTCGANLNTHRLTRMTSTKSSASPFWSSIRKPVLRLRKHSPRQDRLTLNHKEKEFFQNSRPYLIIILAQATGQSNNCPCSPPVSRGFLYLFSFFSLCPFNRPSSIRSLRFCKKLDCPGSCFQCFF